MDRHADAGAYAEDSYSQQQQEGSRHLLSPQPSVPSLKREAEPWRGSSGFGMANILNRPASSSSPSVSTSSSGAAGAPVPTFSLPSLHSFGKPLLTKPELSLGQQQQQQQPQRSLLHEPQSESRYPSMEALTQQPEQSQQHPRSLESSPAVKSEAGNSANSRRIAPAPLDDEGCGETVEGRGNDGSVSGSSTRSPAGGNSIRGGRWSADEHERFLEGFRIHGHKWKRVQQVVRTRSVTQVRTHAQKYLLKVAKLKAERKQGGVATSDSKAMDMAKMGERYQGGSDASNTAPSTPERGAVAGGSPRKTPRKKVRRLEHGTCDPVDQEYIAAAATTLCFLMSQKIDSLFDTRHEGKDVVEPYDCYPAQQPAMAQQAPQSSQPLEGGHDVDGQSRKRSYMHFITDQRDEYSAYDAAPSSRGEPSSYTIEGSKLCS